MKKGLFKQLSAKASEVRNYDHLKGWGKIRYNRKQARPLKFDVGVDLSVRRNERMLCTCGHKVEDQTLTEAKRKMANRVVQLYNKGPYGLLTETLAKEMANGENRRRS